MNDESKSKITEKSKEKLRRVEFFYQRLYEVVEAELAKQSMLQGGLHPDEVLSACLTMAQSVALGTCRNEDLARKVSMQGGDKMAPVLLEKFKNGDSYDEFNIIVNLSATLRAYAAVIYAMGATRKGQPAKSAEGSANV